MRVVKQNNTKKKKTTKKKTTRAKRQEALAALELPKKPSVPSSSVLDYSILIYGQKKIGKTSLASHFDDTIFLMCEPGGKALEIFQVPVRDWSEFTAYVDLIIEENRFKTVVIDTADYAYEYCMEHVCQELVIEHPSEEGYGKGWKAVKSEFTKCILKLIHSGVGVVFISHSKVEEFKNRRADNYNKIVSSMPGQAKDVLEGLIDIWVNYDYDGKSRYLTINGSDEVDAGHRLKNNFKYKDGTAIEKIPMGNTSRQGYDNFIAAFNNELSKGRSSTKTRVKISKKKN